MIAKTSFEPPFVMRERIVEVGVAVNLPLCMVRTVYDDRPSSKMLRFFHPCSDSVRIRKGDNEDAVGKAAMIDGGAEIDSLEVGWMRARRNRVK